MAGKGFETGAKDEFDELQSQIEDLQAAVKRLENIKQPTIPIYQNFIAPNPGDLPDDPIEGQVAIGDDNIHRWFSNGSWHKAASASQTIPWLYMAYGFASPTIPVSPNPAATAGYTVPLVAASGGDYTYDPLIFTPHTGTFNIKQAGLYYAFVVAPWYLDWGRCAVALCTDQGFDTDMFTNVFPSASTYASFNGGFMSRPSFYEGFGGMDHQQIMLTNEYVFAVRPGSSFPTGPAFNVNLDNLSGSPRTFSGDFLSWCYVAQLSKSYVATP